MKRIGIDPLDERFDLDYFKNLISNKKGALKAFLLNQKYVSGIGNIYADEICFDSRIRPDRDVSSLDDREIKMLYNQLSEYSSLQ